jgi:K+-sensing histidine kinase KdpD
VTEDARTTSTADDVAPADVAPAELAPVDVALGELERRRRDRWNVVAVLIVTMVAALAVLLVDEDAVPSGPWLAVALLVVAVLYGISVAVQERRARRAVRALVEERERLGALEGRIAALETLHAVVRDVVAAEDLPGAFERLLRGAAALTDAAGGVVLLRVGDTLTVAASEGVGVAPLGTRLAEDDGAAWRAVRTGGTQVVAAAAEWGMIAGSSTLAVPLQLADRVVGVLVVERTADRPAFSAADRAAAALFAQQAALAVRNASRLDRTAGRVAELERDRAGANEQLRDAVEALRGAIASVTGTTQLLTYRSDGLTAARRQELLDGILDATSRQRELLDRLEELADAPPHPA